MKNAPKKIYLNLGLDPETIDDIDFCELSEVTWSADRTSASDLEYVLAGEVEA